MRSGFGTTSRQRRGMRRIFTSQWCRLWYDLFTELILKLVVIVTNMLAEQFAHVFKVTAYTILHCFILEKSLQESYPLESSQYVEKGQGGVTQQEKE